LYYWHQNPTSIVFRLPLFICVIIIIVEMKKKMFNRKKSKFSFVRRIDMINDWKSAEAKRNNYIRVWVFLSKRPDVLTFTRAMFLWWNRRVISYEVSNSRDSPFAVTLTSVFGKRGEQWDSSALCTHAHITTNVCKHTSPRITSKRHAGRWT